MGYLSFSPLPLASLLFSAICKASSDNHFAFSHFFFLGMGLITASYIISGPYQTYFELPDWFETGKGVRQGCILSPCLFYLYAEHITRNARLDEAQVAFKSRFVIAFLPRGKHLLISWLQSPSAMILEPKKITLFPLFPHLFPMK